MMRRHLVGYTVGLLVAVLGAGAGWAQVPSGVEIGSVATVSGVHDHPLVGYGLVIGLAGTGDSSQATYTVQTVINMLAKFGVRVPSGSQMNIGNVAAVLVTSSLPAFAPDGQQFAVTVSSMGNATSLQGGVLLQTPLQGLDGQVHAMAQGALSIGGFNAQQSGSSIQVNHPTVGMMPTGGLVVAPIPDTLAVDDQGTIRFALRNPDYETAGLIAATINQMGLGQAVAQDATTIVVTPPAAQTATLDAWVGQVLSVRIAPHVSAKVIINERTGTIVAGGDVHLLPAAIANGSIKVIITNTTQVSQPGPLSGGTTQVVPNAQISVQQGTKPMVLVGGAATLSDLVAALNSLGVPPRDLITIIESLQRSGALQAEVEVI